MTERQIIYFLKLAACKSFKKAATELGISQPALSKHISLLEQDLGMRLFHRTLHTVQLTPEGQIMEQAFSRALREVNDGLRAARTLSGTTLNTLRVGIINSWSIDRFKNQLGVDFRTDRYLIYHMSQEDLLEKLYADDLDVMFTFQGNNEPDPSLVEKYAMQSHCYFMLPRKDHPPTTPTPNLAGAPLLIGNYSGIAQQIVRTIQQQHGLTTTAVSYATVETIALDVQNERGIGLISDLSVLFDRKGFVYRDTGIDLPIVAVAQKSTAAKPAVADFLTSLG